MSFLSIFLNDLPNRLRNVCAFCIATCLICCTVSAFGADVASWEGSARVLQATTVTIRVSAPDAENVAQAANAENQERPAAANQVSVCSGIFVAPKLVITSASIGSDSIVRITLAGGVQAKGTLRVVDEFSRLVLLEVDQASADTLTIGEEMPLAGAAVMSASAWGTERAIVSQGIVGAVDRTLPDLTTPALLQCDLRTTETSAGAGVVDRAGKLLGVIIAVDHPETKRGWAYAVPASHVQRLLRTLQEKGGEKSVVVLPRRRPVVGVSLDGDEQGIVIRRVLEGSPAEKAGLAVGDRVLATDGVHIRSVYQALLPTLQKQPGDLMTFQVQRKDGEHAITVVLGGGVVVPSASLQMLGEVIRPQVDVRQTAKGTYAANSPGNPVRELSAGGPPNAAPPAAANGEAVTATQKIALLEKALDRYQSVIEVQQKEIARRDRERTQQAAALEALRREIELLKAMQASETEQK